MTIFAQHLEVLYEVAEDLRAGPRFDIENGRVGAFVSTERGNLNTDYGILTNWLFEVAEECLLEEGPVLDFEGDFLEDEDGQDGRLQQRRAHLFHIDNTVDVNIQTVSY